MPAAIIRMIYRDGFFHADLHPGNLIILPGPKVGFIDLGMVGRLEEELRATSKADADAIQEIARTAAQVNQRMAFDSLDQLKVHGALGYMREAGVEQVVLADLVPDVTFAGRNDLQDAALASDQADWSEASSRGEAICPRCERVSRRWLSHPPRRRSSIGRPSHA